MIVQTRTYIADVDSIGLGQLKGGGVRWQVNTELVFVPGFSIFPLSKRKQQEHELRYGVTLIYTDNCTKYSLLESI